MSNVQKEHAHYDVTWSKFLDQKAFNKYQKRMSPVFKFAASFIQPHDIVLELGCGLGYFAGNYLVSRCKDFRSTDFSPVAVKNARKFYPGIKSKFSLFDARNINKMKYAYNTVVALEIFEHIDEDVEILSQLPQGTKVIFSVPDREIEKSPGVPRGFPVHRRVYDIYSMHERYNSVLHIKKIYHARRLAKAHRIIPRWLVVMGWSK